MNLSALLSRYYLFFACGDAVGKATEFMTLDDIKEKIGPIKGLVDSSLSLCHPELQSWEVTDDTQQNIWLLKRYLKDGFISVDNTVSALLDWVEETHAVEKKYIGPSSLASLNAIKAGKDPNTTGINGTTCGAIMRVPAIVFASKLLGLDMDKSIYESLKCTHNNSIALESAYAYAYALSAALDGKEKSRIIKEAFRGCEAGFKNSPWISAGATLKGRLESLLKLDFLAWSEDSLKDYLYKVMGTGLPSYETSTAVFAFFMYCKDPVSLIMLASETGGDTDTIAALSSSLLSLVDRETAMPKEIAFPVIENNKLELDI